GQRGPDGSLGWRSEGHSEFNSREIVRTSGFHARLSGARVGNKHRRGAGYKSVSPGPLSSTGFQPVRALYRRRASAKHPASRTRGYSALRDEAAQPAPLLSDVGPDVGNDVGNHRHALHEARLEFEQFAILV